MNLPTFVPLSPSPIQLLLSSSALLTECREILDHRITSPQTPPWMSSNISSFLASLSDHEVNLCEKSGLANFLKHTPTNAPQSLKQFVMRASLLSDQIPMAFVPQESSDVLQSPGRSRRRSKKRPRATKRAQIQRVFALTQDVLSWTSTPITRVLDIGAGHGHLASHLASHLSIPVIAVDRDEALLRTAATLHAPLISGPAPGLTLSRAVIGNTQLNAQSGDFLLGLHACGALGDEIIQTAASRDVSAVALVSCCLQKLSKDVTIRRPISYAVKSNFLLREALTLQRSQLGATNRSRGYVSATDITARETRYALRGLLQERGLAMTKNGEEVFGISRHRLRKGLGAVAENALRIRGMNEALDAAELQERMAQAKKDYRKMRSLTLPRAIAGEIMEIAIVLDRAAALEESDKFKHVSVFRIWQDDISVRNLCCVAWR